MKYIIYEQEVFSGSTYSMKDPRAAFLIFSIGKYACTRVKKEEHLKTAIIKLSQEINNMNITSEKVIKEELELTFL